MSNETEGPVAGGNQSGDDRSVSTDTSGSLHPSATHLHVGDALTIQGEDLPPSRELELNWGTVEGGWDVADKNKIRGVAFEPRTDRFDVVRTDEQGRFETAWTIPEDFGGSHTITAKDPSGQVVADSEVTIVPRFELDRTRASLGKVFTISAYGLGPPNLRDNFRVVWDSGMVGYMTGVGNQGTATADIRAVGPPGEHVLRIGPLQRGGSFHREPDQPPYPSAVGDAQAAWTVEVTEAERRPESAWMSDPPAETPTPEHYPALDNETDATLSISPEYGQKGTTAVIEGQDFPPEEEVDLIWYRHSGQRIKGIPITPTPRPDELPTVTTNAAGRFSTEVTIPQDLGGTRPIAAEIGGETVAITGFVIQPDVLDITPTSGPYGTEIEIVLSGVGWTGFDNSLHFVYDNKPLGYVCGGAGREGVDNPGTAVTKLQAIGSPGMHFIDVYPNVFEVEGDAPDFENIPHLSYRENHPVRSLPSLHFAFEITE